jgi:hypothetical protein
MLCRGAPAKWGKAKTKVRGSAVRHKAQRVKRPSAPSTAPSVTAHCNSTVDWFTQGNAFTSHDKPCAGARTTDAVAANERACCSSSEPSTKQHTTTRVSASVKTEGAGAERQQRAPFAFDHSRINDGSFAVESAL